MYYCTVVVLYYTLAEEAQVVVHAEAHEHGVVGDRDGDEAAEPGRVDEGPAPARVVVLQ